MNWHKQQKDLQTGDVGVMVIRFHPDYGMIPAWVRVLERNGDDVTCEVTEPTEASGCEVTRQTLSVRRVLPLSPAEYAGTASRALRYFDDIRNRRIDPARSRLNLRLGHAFDREEDGTYVANEYGVVGLDVSFISVPVGDR
jgi:hypothetical protein